MSGFFVLRVKYLFKNTKSFLDQALRNLIVYLSNIAVSKFDPKWCYYREFLNPLYLALPPHKDRGGNPPLPWFSLKD
ncbi:hypothetical protein HPPN120_07020 [Helicobacter pylori Puno120]|nr:hypothetical protein HPPN120_07020 [Helicobacter pylori Puno120]